MFFQLNFLLENYKRPSHFGWREERDRKKMKKWRENDK